MSITRSIGRRNLLRFSKAYLGLVVYGEITDHVYVGGARYACSSHMHTTHATVNFDVAVADILEK